MNNIKAVIFDLDGTLLNTLEDLTDAVNVALNDYNCPERTIDEVRSFVGNGVKNLMLKAVPDGDNNPLFEDIFARFKEYYGVHCNDKTKPYEGILEVMHQLRNDGYKLAIVSNKIDSAVKELSKLYFEDLVEAAYGECEGIKRKPAPDTVNAALKQLGLKCSDAIYVGDSDVDVMTARNSNMDCISVLWGFRDKDFLLQFGADKFIDVPSEIYKYLQ